MSLGAYISDLEAVLDLDTQANLVEERRRTDLAWQREQALWLAANALPIVCRRRARRRLPPRLRAVGAGADRSLRPGLRAAGGCRLGDPNGSDRFGRRAVGTSVWRWRNPGRGTTRVGRWGWETGAKCFAETVAPSPASSPGLTSPRKGRNGGNGMVSASVSTPIAVLVGEFRDELPEGLSTPLTAGLVIADVLRAVGWSEQAITALAPRLRRWRSWRSGWRSVAHALTVPGQRGGAPAGGGRALREGTGRPAKWRAIVDWMHRACPRPAARTCTCAQPCPSPAVLRRPRSGSNRETDRRSGP